MKAPHRVTEKPVLSGSKVKWTLEQVRSDSQENVRLDWLRFTVPLSAVLRAKFPEPSSVEYLSGLDADQIKTHRAIRAIDASECTNTATGAAVNGARILCGILGEFIPDGEAERGMDFYDVRCSIRYENEVVGNVLAGGKSDAQASTVHFNLHGKACLQLRPFQWHALRAWIEQVGGWITRVDLALDVFEGRDIHEVRDGWLSGAFDVRGKRPSQSEFGSWTAGHSRTFQVGQRLTGKVFRAYEKGDELFGHEASDPWIRYEVEFRSSSRIIDLDVMSRPADFFAGAYPFLESLLLEVQGEAQAERIPTFRKLRDQCELAAAKRVVRWVIDTAGPSLACIWNQGGDMILDIVEQQKGRYPQRLVGFARENITRALEKVAAGMSPAAAPSMLGA